MKKNIKPILALLLCAVLAVGVFAGCSVSFTKTEPIDIKSALGSLLCTEEELGLAGKYEKLADIKVASIDEAIVGTWFSADGELKFTYNSDGTCKVEAYDSQDESVFTCLTVGEKKILAQEATMTEYDENDKEVESTVVTYSAYSTNDNVMCMAAVGDEANDGSNQKITTLQVYYKADEDGSIDSALTAHPYDIASLKGTWKGDKGDLVFDGENLTVGEESYKVYFGGQNELTVEKDNTGFLYELTLTYSKYYGGEDNKLESESYGIGLTYTGENKDDRPNLENVLDDLHAEMDYNEYLFSGMFKLAE